MSEYRQWLDKKAASEKKALQLAMDNYQETGIPRYYTSQWNHEYMVRALQAAIAAEDKRETDLESRARTFKGLHEWAVSLKEFSSPEEVLDKVLSELLVHSYTG